MIVVPPPWSRFPALDRTTTSYLLWTMLFRGGGALWAVLVLPPLLRKMQWCDHQALCPAFGGTPPDLPLLPVPVVPQAAAAEARPSPHTAADEV